MARRILVALVFLLVGTALAPAGASADRTFAKRFGVNDTGDIAMAGNTLMTCPSSCAAENGVGSGANLNDNNYSMIRVNADAASDASLFDSSSATLSLPAGATVLTAYLYWGADSAAGGGGGSAPIDASDAGLGTVKFAGATGPYQTVAADQLDKNGSRYQGIADVTTAVQAQGAGLYRVGNVQSGTGTDRYAGWSLVVAYHDDNAPPRNLTIFDGFGVVSSASPTMTINVSGFTTPPSGTVKTTLGAVSYEGDLGSTGDGLRLNSTLISDATNPVDNVFNSTSSDHGVLASSGRSPNQSNLMGFDADLFTADGILANNATSASLTLTTGGETYYPGALTFATELLAPRVRTNTTVVDLNGGNVEPGDTLEYTISGTNSGNDSAGGLSVATDIPDGLNWVPGSMRVVGGSPAAQTDAAGDDLGTWDANAKRTTFNVGSGATSGHGGTLAPAASFSTTFRVTVDPSANGQTISVPGASTYVATNGTDNYTTGGISDVIHVMGPDEKVVVAHADPLVRGADTSYTLTVSNVGFGPTHGSPVVVVDDVPAGLHITGPVTGTGWSCSTTGQHVSCTRSDALAAGDAYPPITIPVHVRQDAPSSIDDTASVSGGSDNVPTNDSDTSNGSASSSSDLSLTEDPPSTIVAGQTGTWTFHVHNDGPTDATGVTVTATLPAGTTFVSAGPGVSCVQAGTTLTCHVAGTLADGDTADLPISLHVGPGVGAGAFPVSGDVSATQSDPSTGDEHAAASVPLTRQADVSVTTAAPDAPLVAGLPATFVSTVSDAGPSDANDVVVTIPVPGVLDGAHATVTGADGTCEVANGTATCHITSIPTGGHATVTLTGTVAASTPAGTSVAVAATAHASDPDPDAANDSSSRNATVDSVADLSIEAITPAGPIPAGQNATVTLNVHSAGPSDATNVTVTQVLPEGVTPVDLDPRCTFSGRTVTCVLGTVHPGTTEPITFTVVSTGVIDGAQLGTDVSVGSAGTADPNAADNSTGASSPSVAAPGAGPAAAAGPTYCHSRRHFKIRLRVPLSAHLKKLTVLVAGRPVHVTRGKRLTAVVDLRGVRAARMVVRIIARTKNGKTISGIRAYRTCTIRLAGGKPKL